VAGSGKMGYIGRGQDVEGRTQEARYGGQDMGLGKGGRIWRGRIGEGVHICTVF
jgi:hypothetical protein